MAFSSVANRTRVSIGFAFAIAFVVGAALFGLPGRSAGATEPDKSPPSVTLSGTAIQAVEEGKTSGSYELRIVAADGSKTAPQSGVGKIEVAVDGATQQSWEAPCPEGSCGLTESWTYSPGNYAPVGGGHVITVKVTDRAGNITEQKVSREGVEAVPGEAAPTGSDVTAPDVGFYGSAVKAIEEGATTGNYELRIAATDGSPSAPQSGVTKIEVAVDGITRQSWEKSCPIGSCRLEEAWPYAPGNFPGTGHTITITVRDRSGNVATRTIQPSSFPRLLASYPFEEGSGTVTEDVTGNGHTGTLSPKGVVWATGKYGNGLKFDGKEGCVTVPDSPALQLHEAFSLEAWVQPEGELLHLPAIYKQAEGFPAYALGVGLTTAGKAEGQIGTATRSHIDVASPSTLPANTWSHEAITFDGTNLRLYVNGTLVATQAVTLPAAGVAGPLEIGCSPSGHFRGTIDEVRIYNQALSESQIQVSLNGSFPIVGTTETKVFDANDVLLTGTAKAYGSGNEYYFEYGPTQEYGNVANGEEIPGTGKAQVVHAPVFGLAPETTYHYRVVVEGPLGRSFGKDLTVTTGTRTISVEKEKAEEEAEAAAMAGRPAGVSRLTKVANSPFFGIDWSGDLEKMANPANNAYQAIEETGSEWVRIGLVPGRAGIGKAFAEAKARGLKVLPYIGEAGAPKTAAERKPFLDFAQEMVEKYGSEVEYWEIGNEPNMPHGTEAVEPAAFASYYKAVALRMRSVSTGVQFLTPGLYGYRETTEDDPKKGTLAHETPSDFLGKFNTALGGSLPNPYVGISLHPYIFKVRTHPKKQQEPAHRPTDQHDAEVLRNEVGASVWELHNTFKAKPIWVTELGFPVNTADANKNPAVSQPEQALLTKLSFSMLRNKGASRLAVVRAMYYNIEDNPPGNDWARNAGLISAAEHFRRPAYTAFKEVVE